MDNDLREGIVEKKKVRQKAGRQAGRQAGLSTSEISAYSAPLTHKLHSPKTTSKAPPHGVFNLVSPSNVG